MSDKTLVAGVFFFYVDYNTINSNRNTILLKKNFFGHITDNKVVLPLDEIQIYK